MSGDEFSIENLVYDREGAWDAFVETATGRAMAISGRILRNCPRAFGSRDLMTDVLQESFKRFLHQIRSRPDGGIAGDPVRYFLRIVYTQTIEALRGRKNRRAEDLDDIDEPAVEDERHSASSRWAFCRLLRRSWPALTNRQRRVCIAWYRTVRRDGAVPSVRELAARTGLTETSCWTSMRAIRRKLRERSLREA